MMADAAVADLANDPAENHSEVYQWLHDAASARNISAKFHTELVKQDQNWLYIPVYVQGEDAAVKARTLQQLEDAWRDQEPEPYWQLLLIPAAN